MSGTESASTPSFPEPLHVGRPNIGSREAFSRLVDEMFERRWLSNGGPLVQQLEARLADYLGVSQIVSMVNGTVALEIAIRSLGLTGEVIVPSFTFVATAHALQWQGITPVFADIDPSTHNLDPRAVKRMITPRTSGIIGVHLWGRPAPVEELSLLASECDLALLFDAAHAFGSSHNGQMIGSFGQAEVFSFHATKFFNTFEGGAVATNDPALAEKMRLMRNFGFRGYDNVIYPGTNGKMTEVCAAMGLVNLDSLDEFIEVNRTNYEAYASLLGGVSGIRLLSQKDTDSRNFQYVVVEVMDMDPGLRDRIVQRLHEHNVLARKYFWPAVHRMEPYRSLFPHAGLLLPHTQEVAERVLLLPTGTSVTRPDIEAVCEILLDCLGA